jgi:hypothetical protein
LLSCLQAWFDQVKVWVLPRFCIDTKCLLYSWFETKFENLSISAFNLFSVLSVQLIIPQRIWQSTTLWFFVTMVFLMFGPLEMLRLKVERKE